MRIDVIGAGVAGLTTAIQLSNAGHKVRVLAQRVAPFIDSSSACAIFLPFFQDDQQDPRYTNRMKRWSEDTLNLMTELESHDEAGVSRHQAFELFEARSQIPDFLTTIFPDASIYEDTRLPKEYSIVTAFETYVAHSTRFLRWLTAQLTERGVSTQFWTASADRLLPDSSADVIVNCMGYGSHAVFKDPNMKPVRGQIIVIDQKISDTAIAGGDFCVYPRGETSVLGSLWLEGEDRLLPSEHSTKILFDKYNHWKVDVLPFFLNDAVPELNESDVSMISSGVRAVRNQVRLEFDEKSHILHNYGHGGIGFSIAWGCANEVVEIISSF